LEQILKACVQTIGEGVDAYCMMINDLNKKVDDIDGRLDYLVQVIKERQADIEELSTRFACIANACSSKNEKEEDIYCTPREN
jgi:peptidoglycan hydrolase CwlO-like protein